MKYSIITIEREYASGGRDIGRLAAEKLGIPCYSGEILQMAAEQIGSTAKFAGYVDEKAPNSLLYSLAMMAKTIPMDSNTYTFSPENKLQRAQAQLITKLAERESCVIIGHCAGAILKERPNVLKIFIRASRNFRRERAVFSYGVPEREADSLLRKNDRMRANYYNFYSEQKWDDITGYHLILDSGKLGPECCAAIIAAAAR